LENIIVHDDHPCQEEEWLPSAPFTDAVIRKIRLAT
jgi:hypothetical protein